MPRGKPLKNPNGYGSVVKLSGNRRKPFEVRVNTRMDERYYPVYDVLGRFPTREEALIALAEYHRNPYNISDRGMTFSQLYEKFYKNKYEYSGKTYSQSSIYCTQSAYAHCSALYERPYSKLRADDFRRILGQINSKGKPLSHAMQEHIKNLFSQMDKFALQNDIIEKGYASYAAITVSEDDTPGVPFTAEELQILWDNVNIPWVDSILIYIYSGGRISELILMPAENINLEEGTFKGGLKTDAGKNRIVPIHSKIRNFVEHRLSVNHGILFSINDRPITAAAYTKIFKKTLKEIGIDTYHTPHDCRHTFTSMLDSARVNQVCIDRLVGHASGSLTTRTYTHKTVEELRQAIEMI
ncbi:MAG: tyrosine-type recombinase/integrase [Roseburia sp.]|nr:tyrosine-type recombinase/integrase [Roseburia sp.]